jgi:hypothetical protein
MARRATGSPMSSASSAGIGRSRSELAAAAIALLACMWLLATLVYLAGRPLDTSDLWWHLALGEVYSEEGPWPGADPLLHTAHPDAPVQHEWLFGVLLHGVYRVGGFGCLRIAHVLAVIGIVGLAASLFRGRAGSAPGAPALTWLALGSFVTLAWWRLFQLRPDLASIAAALLLTRLLFLSSEAPGARKIAVAAALLAVWANLHSLFAVGLALIVAALLGLGLEALLQRAIPAKPADPGEAAARRARALGAVLALGTLGSLLNPRGWAQHMTFFTSSRESAIWHVRDEWTHFDPFRWGHYAEGSVPFTSWLVMDAIGLAFVLASVATFIGFVRRPSRAALGRFDPALFGLSVAAFVAILVSVRFLWLSFLPLLYLLQLAGRSESRRAQAAFAWAAAAASVALVSGSSLAHGFERSAASLQGYWSRPYDTAGYPIRSVRFLAATGLTGNLFNAYEEGGFLGYWLAPKLRTFIDSRTEHYSLEVVRDYTRVNRQRGRTADRSFLEILDEYRVDVFLGSGLPERRDLFKRAAYTTAHLDGAPGWIPVFRSVDQAIHLRRNERNRENLARVTAFYAAEDVPFDPDTGLDVEVVIATRPDWAVVHGMLPARYLELLLEARSEGSERRFEALDRLGYAYAAIGAYRSQVRADREASALRPRAPAPRRRLVFGLLHLGRPAAALTQARELHGLDASDPRTAIFLSTARLLQGWDGSHSPDVNRKLGELPLLVESELREMFSQRYLGPPSTDPGNLP